MFQDHIKQFLNCRVSMMIWIWSGKNFCGLGWVWCKNFELGWFGFQKSDPCPTPRSTSAVRYVRQRDHEA